MTSSMALSSSVIPSQSGTSVKIGSWATCCLSGDVLTAIEPNISFVIITAVAEAERRDGGGREGASAKTAGTMSRPVIINVTRPPNKVPQDVNISVVSQRASARATDWGCDLFGKINRGPESVLIIIIINLYVDVKLEALQTTLYILNNYYFYSIVLQYRCRRLKLS